MLTLWNLEVICCVFACRSRPYGPASDASNVAKSCLAKLMAPIPNRRTMSKATTCSEQDRVDKCEPLSVSSKRSPNAPPNLPPSQERDEGGREGSLYVCYHIPRLLQLLRLGLVSDYDLVRIYHPDSPVARAGGVSAETAHARFQAISSAYASLSGKKLAATLDGTDPEGFGASTRSSYHDLSTAMWRARQRRRAELDVGLDERWKERIMVGAVLLVRNARNMGSMSRPACKSDGHAGCCSLCPPELYHALAGYTAASDILKIGTCCIFGRLHQSKGSRARVKGIARRKGFIGIAYGKYAGTPLRLCIAVVVVRTSPASTDSPQVTSSALRG